MPEAAPASSLTADQPWPGPKPYTEADRTFFHGRKRETEEVRRLLCRDAITLLSGPAGSGKTSLIRAGLIPTLNGDWLPVMVSLNWEKVSEQEPLSKQVLSALKAAGVAKGLQGPDAPEAEETLWEAFHRAGVRWWNARQRVITPVLILDDFGKAFTEGVANATIRRHRDRFLEELSQLVGNRPPPKVAGRLESGADAVDAFDFGSVPVRIVMVVDDEFAPRLSGLRMLFPTLGRGELRLTDFAPEQARDALMRASAQRGLFAEGVVDQVLARIRTGPDSDHPVRPGRLSQVAGELALERQRRNAAQITADFIAPVDTPQVAATATSSPATVGPEASSSAEAKGAGAPVLLVLTMLLVLGLGAYAWRTRMTDRQDTSAEVAFPNDAAAPELPAARVVEAAGSQVLTPTAAGTDSATSASPEPAPAAAVNPAEPRTPPTKPTSTPMSTPAATPEPSTPQPPPQPQIAPTLEATPRPAAKELPTPVPFRARPESERTTPPEPRELRRTTPPKMEPEKTRKAATPLAAPGAPPTGQMKAPQSVPVRG